MAATIAIPITMSRSPFLERMACSELPLSAPPHKSNLLFDPNSSSICFSIVDYIWLA